ncbi:uncharacterized protein LOC131855806 isoform X1 [Cryptomeria japonica]|uniref:uncharacterized protein LOC131855806 isoform X1 n=1 Tax=Cryptomeria japonica TaxID=3369 RepID=UPI0027D9FFE9|nr:uncharacterized protein LOC131855806 isoform X1 [Cryptomeria japonica]
MGGLSLWFTGVETMADLKEVVNSVLLPLQLSLGLLLIMKTTPLWAVIHCTLAYLLHCLCFPYTDYKQLGEFQGRVFKKVISHATTAGDVSKLKNQKDAQESKKEGKSQIDDTVSVVYLGKKFVLKRMEGNKMLMKDGPGYCITDKMWETVKYIEKMASNTVFVKNHKEIWEEVVTGDIMKFEEVLNSVILDNRAVIRLDHDYFLPVNLLLSEDKLMTILNFVGLFLKTQKHIHWLIPASLTFASVSMGFSTKVRLWIDGFINAILCRSVQLLCDPLPLAMRRRAYCWGNWVENLKPGNDLQSKIVSGKVCLLVAAGAKADSEFFADCESLASRGGGAKAHLGTSTECESSADLVIMADQNYIRALLPGGKKTQPEADPSVDSEQVANRSVDSVHEIWPKVGPFLFK